MNCIKCKKVIEDNSIYCRYCGKKQISTPAPKVLRRANGMGTVYKKAGRRRRPWTAQVTVDRRRISLGAFDTRTEALMALEKATLSPITSMYDYTVQEIYEELIRQNEEKLSKSGLTNYISGYKYLQPYAKMKMRDIRTYHIQEAINYAAENEKGYATWKKIQNVASLMCQIGMANDLIDKNYAQLVNMPQAPQKTEKVAFNDDQLDTLWQHWQNDDVIMAILALCYNGLRINEFLSLKKSHVDINERIIYAPGSKTQAGKDRIIAIPEDVVPLYTKMLRSEGMFLYPSPQGKKFDAKNFRERFFYPTLEKYDMTTNAGGKITPHSCRHTYASLCVKNDLNKKATMDLMGHTKYSTTVELYAESTKKDIEFLRNEADKLKKKTK